MAKGYVYIMTTAVDGIIKIGKSNNWNRRCQDELERNGYRNMNSLKTFFVIETNDYTEIESTMHDIFHEGRVIASDGSKTELFACDKNRAKRVLEKMGTQVFPEKSNSNSNIREKTLYTLKDVGIKIGDILVAKDFPNIEVEVIENDKTQSDKVKYIGNASFHYEYDTKNGKHKIIDVQPNTIITANALLLAVAQSHNGVHDWNSRHHFCLKGDTKSIYEIAQEKGLCKKTTIK